MRFIGYALLFLVALAAGAAVGVPGMVDRVGLKLEYKLERTLGVDLQVGSVDWTFDGDLALADVTVRLRDAPVDEPPILTAREIALKADVRPGQMKVRLETVHVVGGRLDVRRRADGTDNVRALAKRVRDVFAPSGEERTSGASGGGLSRYLVKTIPKLTTRDLTVAVDAGPVVVPEGLGLPTRVELRRGTVTVENTSLIREEDNLTVTARFQDTSLDPGQGLSLSTTLELAGGALPIELAFDRPARVRVGRRVVAVGALRWKRGRLELDDVALSVPVREEATARDEPVDPAVTVKQVRVFPGQAFDPATIKQALGSGDRMSAARKLIEAIERIELHEPALMVERTPTGHNFSDLVGPVGVSEEPKPSAEPGPDKALGVLMEATRAASERLAGQQVAVDGSRLRGFLVRGFGRFERAVARVNAAVIAAAGRVPFRDLVIKGGHFAWRDGRRQGADPDGPEGNPHRLEKFDLEARRDGDLLTFETSFVMPGSSSEQNTISGKVHMTTGDTQLRARIARLKVYPYRHLMPASLPVDPEMTVHDTDLTLVWSPGHNVARIEGEMALGKVAFHYPALAAEPLRDMEVEMRFNAQLDRKRKTLVMGKSAVKLGLIPMTVRFDVSDYDSAPQLSGVVRIDRARAQDIADSLPREFVPLLEGMRVKGTVGWHLDFSLDSNDIESLVYHSYPDVNGFEVVDLGSRLNLDAVRGTFLHRVEEADGNVREMLVGPGSSGWVPLSRISRYMIKAVTTTEDGGFFRHDGFSSYAIRQSIITNLKKGGFYRGASTISQQLVKNLFLSRRKTISRKVQEAFITWQLESALSKERILALYFNVIEWGPGIYGVRQAARHYFGKHPSELTPLDAVFLVSIIPNPKRYYYQFRRGEVTDGWRRHLRWIMSVMAQRGKISEETFLGSAPYSPYFRGQKRPEPSPGGVSLLPTRTQ